MKKIIILSILLLQFVITACSDSVSMGDRITVSGKVVNAYTHSGYQSKAMIEDQVSDVDAEGRFSIYGVQPPYDLKIINHSPGDVWVGTQIEGLRISDPQILLPSRYYPYKYQHMMHVKIPSKLTSEQKIRFYFREHNAVSAVDLQSSNVDSVTFLMHFQWHKDPMVKGDLIYLVEAGDLGVIYRYDAFYMKKDVTLTDSEDLTVLNVGGNEIINPGEATVNGNIIYPPNSGTLEKTINFSFKESGMHYEGYSPSTSSASINYKIPTGIPITPRIIINAYTKDTAFHGFESYSEFTNGSSIRLDNGPREVFPPHFANMMDSNTTFVWTGGDDFGVYVLRLSRSWNGEELINIVTTDLEAVLPNFSSLGYSYPPGFHRWRVTKYKGYYSVDDFLKDPYKIKSKGEISSHNRVLILNSSQPRSDNKKN